MPTAPTRRAAAGPSVGAHRTDAGEARAMTASSTSDATTRLRALSRAAAVNTPTRRAVRYEGRRANARTATITCRMNARWPRLSKVGARHSITSRRTSCRASSSSGKRSTRGPRGEPTAPARCRRWPNPGSAARPTGAEPSNRVPSAATASSTRPSGNEPWLFTHTQPIGTSHRGSNRPSMANAVAARHNRPTMKGRSAQSCAPTARKTATAAKRTTRPSTGRSRRPGQAGQERGDQRRSAGGPHPSPPMLSAVA